MVRASDIHFTLLYKFENYSTINTIPANGAERYLGRSFMKSDWGSWEKISIEGAGKESEKNSRRNGIYSNLFVHCGGLPRRG